MPLDPSVDFVLRGLRARYVALHNLLWARLNAEISGLTNFTNAGVSAALCMFDRRPGANWTQIEKSRVVSECREVAPSKGGMVISPVLLNSSMFPPFGEIAPCTRRGSCPNPRRWQMPLQLEQPLRGGSGRQRHDTKWSELPLEIVEQDLGC